MPWPLVWRSSYDALEKLAQESMKAEKRALEALAVERNATRRMIRVAEKLKLRLKELREAQKKLPEPPEPELDPEFAKELARHWGDNPQAYAFGKRALLETLKNPNVDRHEVLMSLSRGIQVD